MNFVADSLNESLGNLSQDFAGKPLPSMIRQSRVRPKLPVVINGITN